MVQSITDDMVAGYLAKVAESGVMGKSERRMRLLEHLIRAEVGGEGEALKAYSIGLDVFEKQTDFDPAIDSSVRVEMGRLRAALAIFEGSNFADTKIVVDVPVGTYQPQVTLRSGQPATPATLSKRGSLSKIAIAAAVVLIMLGGFWWGGQGRNHTSDGTTVRLALQSFEGDPAITARVESALRRGLVRNQTLTVLSSDEAEEADFSLRGLVTPSGETVHRINAELVNLNTDRLVWAKSIVVAEGTDLEDRIGRVFGNDLRVRLFGASKVVLQGRDPLTLTPEQLFVMATWVPGPAMNAVEWELERIDLMDIALQKEPNFGAAHSVMADKLAYLANVYAPSNTAELREKAAMHAQRALELAPLNPDVVFNVAQSQWHAGRIEDSHVSMLRVLELDPGHDLARFLGMVIPYSCEIPPDAVVEQAIAFDNSLSADNPIRWLTLTWIAWLHAHQGDYEAALAAERRAAVIFEIPYTFMRHAMLLNMLGDPDAAAEIIERQRVNWPDISPDHFAEVTIPRICQEEPEGQQFIANYQALATAMQGRF